jgi:hypothetical protein
MALGSTQSLTEISIRNISWGKDGRCVGLTTLPPTFADCLEIWEPRLPGTLYSFFFTLEQKRVPVSSLSHSCHMTTTSHPPELYQSNIFAVGYKVQGTRNEVQSKKFLIMQFFYPPVSTSHYIHVFS